MFTTPVSANAETLMRQSGMTAQNYLRYALEAIDAEMGEGQARKNPQLVAAFIAACASDMHTTFIAQTLQESTAALEEAIRSCFQDPHT